jgi:flagellar M-ring protein FliF
MSNLAANWNQLSMQKKLVLTGVMLATLAAFWMLMNVASRPHMAFLYGGLDPAAAGEILSALEGMDVAAEVRGDAIYVPQPKRDEVRMALARQGLPQQGQAGFELLDEMNGFAVTSDMFDATYWRAKEGELARTILATPGVKSARVHIAAPKTSSFSRQRRSPSASVTITMSRGRLDRQHAVAIRYLVALGVPDLDPEKVAIIDSLGGVILKPGSQNALEEMETSDNDRARKMERALANMLEAHVGPDNVRVNISLKVDRERETVSERILDPASRVMMARETTEIQQSDSGSGNAVTVASNLPDGDAASAPSGSKSERSEANQTTRFDISEVNRKREKMPGAIAQVHVAVLVNETDPTPRSTEELTALGELVATAIGFDEARGDKVTVKAMSFHQEEEGVAEAPVTGGAMAFLQDNLISMLQIFIPAVVVLALAMFVLKPILTQSPAAQSASQVAAPEIAGAIEPPAVVAATKTPVDALQDLASADTGATATVLTSWLDETEAA